MWLLQPHQAASLLVFKHSYVRQYLLGSQNLRRLIWSLAHTMAVFGLYPIHAIVVFTLLLVPTHSLNDTTNILRSPTPERVGWFDVSYRATSTILYSCLSTIVACTYTSLHLNVPSPLDGKWTRLQRKAKWMFLTILFPEFTFAKAIRELQMAAEDWCNLRRESVAGNFNWTFENSKSVEALNDLFRFCMDVGIWAYEGGYPFHNFPAWRANNDEAQPVQRRDWTPQPEAYDDISSSASLRAHVLESQR